MILSDEYINFEISRPAMKIIYCNYSYIWLQLRTIVNFSMKRSCFWLSTMVPKSPICDTLLPLPIASMRYFIIIFYSYRLCWDGTRIGHLYFHK